jgi:hypothetical protein
MAMLLIGTSGLSSYSSSKTRFSVPLHLTVKIAASTVTPKATALSGLMDLQGFFLLKNNESMD